MNKMVVYVKARVSDTITMINPPEAGADPVFMGCFVHTGNEGDYLLENPPKKRARLVREIEPGKWQGTPADQISFLHEIVNDLGIDPPAELGRAKEILEGTEDLNALDVILEKAQDKIHGTAYKLMAEKTEQQRSQGGKESWGLTAEERQERNRLMQAEIDRLCLENGKSYNAACSWVAINISKIHTLTEKISFDRVKKLTKNPKK
ncbi:MAG: hypothetical protein R6U41_07255 [Desulfosalsimonas sp.]|uniref:hypothetical protein n=1 Tax=Desulfosalsimonas sp. TaxID=3073848 RepID=UPI0039707B5A